jgi:uncharacterized membrane protein YcaP (DUF421 family)
MINWQEILMFDVPFLEIFVRGSIMYLFLILIMRFGMNRVMGTIGVSDMLVIVVIADASQNAMAGSYNSVGDGLVLVGTIVFWAWLFDFLSYHFPVLESILQPRQVCLIRNGRYMRQNMAKELITKEELMGQLRINGIEDIKQVKEACIESNGEISVIPVKGKHK